MILSDPLSGISRKERRFLMLTSGIGALIVTTGLIPSKINALGIEFAESDQQSILFCLSGLILYFLFAFIIYGSADFITICSRINGANHSRVLKERDGATDAENYDDLDVEEVRPDILDQRHKINKISLIITKFRIFFEFIFPPVFAIIVVIYLVLTALK